MCGCSKSAKAGTSHRLNYISNGVGRWLAAAVVINENRTAFGCYRINDYMKIKPSSDGQRMRPPPVADKGSICWRSGRFCAALQAA